MDKKQKSTVKDNIGAFFQTCKVNKMKFNSMLAHKIVHEINDIILFGEKVIVCILNRKLIASNVPTLCRVTEKKQNINPIIS
jgi:hypothetical protein